MSSIQKINVNSNKNLTFNAKLRQLKNGATAIIARIPDDPAFSRWSEVGFLAGVKITRINPNPRIVEVRNTRWGLDHKALNLIDIDAAPENLMPVVEKPNLLTSMGNKIRIISERLNFIPKERA